MVSIIPNTGSIQEQKFEEIPQSNRRSSWNKLDDNEKISFSLFNKNTDIAYSTKNFLLSFLTHDSAYSNIIEPIVKLFAKFLAIDPKEPIEDLNEIIDYWKDSVSVHKEPERKTGEDSDDFYIISERDNKLPIEFNEVLELDEYDTLSEKGYYETIEYLVGNFVEYKKNCKNLYSLLTEFSHLGILGDCAIKIDKIAYVKFDQEISFSEKLQILAKSNNATIQIFGSDSIEIPDRLKPLCLYTLNSFKELVDSIDTNENIRKFLSNSTMPCPFFTKLLIKAQSAMPSKLFKGIVKKLADKGIRAITERQFIRDKINNLKEELKENKKVKNTELRDKNKKILKEEIKKLEKFLVLAKSKSRIEYDKAVQKLVLKYTDKCIDVISDRNSLQNHLNWLRPYFDLQDSLSAYASSYEKRMAQPKTQEHEKTHLEKKVSAFATATFTLLRDLSKEILANKEWCDLINSFDEALNRVEIPSTFIDTSFQKWLEEMFKDRDEEESDLVIL